MKKPLKTGKTYIKTGANKEINISTTDNAEIMPHNAVFFAFFISLHLFTFNNKYFTIKNRFFNNKLNKFIDKQVKIEYNFFIFKKREISMPYLYEMHAHVSEVSACSSCSAQLLSELYLNTDYKGIVVTDHINPSSFFKNNLENASWEKKMEHFISGYEAVKKAVDGKMNVILGMELKFNICPNDYLVYGITEEFLFSHGDLMAYEPEDFFKLAHDNNLLVIQAHPFRRGSEITNWKKIDGYEVYNGNLRHYSCNPMAEEWAKYHNMAILTAGSDFHEIEDACHGGIYFEKEILTPQELVEELKSGNYTLKKDKFKHSKEE